MNQPRPPLLRDAEGGVLISLSVVPGAKRTTHVYEASGLKIRLAAPPVDGKANEELVRYLAEQLEIPRSRVTVVKGQTERRKTVLVAWPRAELESKPLFFRA